MMKMRRFRLRVRLVSLWVKNGYKKGQKGASDIKHSNNPSKDSISCHFNMTPALMRVYRITCAHTTTTRWYTDVTILY